MWEDDDDEEEDIILPHTPKGKEAFKKLEWWQDGIQCYFSENELEFLFRHFIIYAEIEKDKTIDSKNRNAILQGYKKNLKVILNLGLEQYTNSGLFQFFSAKYELLFGSVNKAIEDLYDAKIYDPYNQEIIILLASCFERKGQYVDAVNSIIDFEKTGESLTVETYIKLINLLYVLEDGSKIVYYLKQIVKSNQHDELMRLFEFDFEFEDMIVAAKELIDEEPFNHEYWHILGYYYHLLEEFDKAIDAFEYAYYLNEKSFSTLQYLGDVNREAGNFNKAIEWYLLALDEDKETSFIQLQIAVCLNRLGELAKARDYLLKLRKNDDLLFEICTEMAYSYLEDDSPKKALPWLEKALSISPQIPVYVMIGEAHYQLNDLLSAFEIYKEALKFAERFELENIYAFFFGIFYRAKALDKIDLLLSDFEDAKTQWVRPQEEYIIIQTLFKAMIFRHNNQIESFQSELLHCFVLNAEFSLSVLEKIDLELLEDPLVISIKDLF